MAPADPVVAARGRQPAALGPPQIREYGPPADGGVTVRTGGRGTQVVAGRAFAYGEPILREEPLLLVPKDAVAFLKSAGTDAMIAIARRLGDVSRLAVFAAFCRLPESKQQEVLAMGLHPGSAVLNETRRVVHMFCQDFPQLTTAIDWGQFCQVVSIVSAQGSQLASGERVLYQLSGQVEHSCSPNAVVETLSDSGVREVRAIAHAGISENEVVTVSFVEEETLVLPLDRRRDAIKAARNGFSCLCSRCEAGEDAGDALALLTSVSKASRNTDEASLRSHLKELTLLDTLLPFALVGKARVRAKLARACELCSSELLDEAVALYETSITETTVILGRKGWHNAHSVNTRLKELRERLD